MSSFATRDAATSSCVESGFDAQSAMSAPPAARVCMRFAVAVGDAREDVADGRDARAAGADVRARGRGEQRADVDSEVDLPLKTVGREVRARRVTVQIDDVLDVLGAQSRDGVGDARLEDRDIDGHAMHAVEPLEAVRDVDRDAPGRWCRDDKTRLAQAFAEDAHERLGLAGREAWTERQRLDDEGRRDDLVGPRRDPPAGALDVRRVEVRERVRGEQAIALEEAADARGRDLLFDMDLG